MPIDERSGAASGRLYGRRFRGRETLSEVLGLSRRGVTNAVANLNTAGIATKIRQRANHTTVLELDYRLHRDRRIQVPEALCEIDKPAERGNAAKVYAYLQTSATWERTRNECATGANVTPRAAASALTTLRRIGLIDRNHDPEPGKTRRPADRQRSPLASRNRPSGPSDKSCHLVETNTAISRADERNHELVGNRSSFPQHAVRDTSAHRREASELADRLLDRHPATNLEHAKIARLLAQLLATGLDPDTITKSVDEGHPIGPLSQAHHRAALLQDRLKNFDPSACTARCLVADLEAIRQPPDPHRRIPITNPEAIAAHAIASRPPHKGRPTTRLTHNDRASILAHGWQPPPAARNPSPPKRTLVPRHVTESQKRITAAHEQMRIEARARR